MRGRRSLPLFDWLVILPLFALLFTSSSQSAQSAKVRYATSTGGASERRDGLTADVDPLERDRAMIQNGGGGRSGFRSGPAHWLTKRWKAQEADG